jgi:hypothetical protein
MNDLSPAAQAVKDAVLALYADKNVHKFGWQLDAPTVAAVLRAAAQQLRTAYANEEYVDSADDYLDDIANELEKTND